MKKTLLFAALAATMTLASCENYSVGERVGLITKMNVEGAMYKSHEGELHVTQTGMNSSMNEFDFSIDNDDEPVGLLALLDSAEENGWKVKLYYHQTSGKNWFSNRGATNTFVTRAEVLDKNMMPLVQQSRDTTKH